MKHDTTTVTRFTTLLVLLLAGVAQAGPLPTARPEEVGMSSERLERIATAFSAAIDSGELPGVVVNVARGGKLVYSTAIGWQDKPNGIRMREDSIFRIYSMTKPIVSVAAMTLVEQGKLSLADPVSKFIPAFADTMVGIENRDSSGVSRLELVKAERQMTVQDLLRHTSGLTYGVIGPKNEVKKLYDAANIFSQHWLLEDFANTLATLPLQYQPGSTWEYGHSTDILGRVVEVASGMTLDRYLDQAVLGPLAMKDTSFGVPENKHSRIAEPIPDKYTGKTPDLLDVRKPMVFFAGGHGLTSTAGDYLRFCQMLLGGGKLDGKRVLGPRTVHYMASNHVNEDISKGTFYIPGPGYGFGLGFATRLEDGQSNWPGTTGEYFWAGYGGTYFWIDPEEDLVVSYMSQEPLRRQKYRVLLRNLVYQAILE